MDRGPNTLKLYQMMIRLTKDHASYLVNSTKSAGFAARQAEEVKNNKYLDKMPPNLLFVPIVLESYGGFGPAAVPIIRRIGKALSDKNKYDVSASTVHLATRLSMKCQQGLAEMLECRYLPLSQNPPLPL